MFHIGIFYYGASSNHKDILHITLYWETQRRATISQHIPTLLGIKIPKLGKDNIQNLRVFINHRPINKSTNEQCTHEQISISFISQIYKNSKNQHIRKKSK